MKQGRGTWGRHDSRHMSDHRDQGCQAGHHLRLELGAHAKACTGHSVHSHSVHTPSTGAQLT